MLRKTENVAAKKSIIESAVKVFAENGYVKSTPEQICARANISKGVLIHHFNSKKGLYYECVSYASEILLEKFMSDCIADETDVFRRLKKYLNFVYGLVENHYDLYAILKDAAVIAESPNEIEISTVLDTYALKIDTLMKSNLSAKSVKNNINCEKMFTCLYDITKLYNSFVLEKCKNEYKSFGAQGDVIEMLEYFKNGVYRKANDE